MREEEEERRGFICNQKRASACSMGGKGRWRRGGRDRKISIVALLSLAHPRLLTIRNVTTGTRDTERRKVLRVKKG